MTVKRRDTLIASAASPDADVAGRTVRLGLGAPLIGVLIGRSAGVDLKHVPYRGTQRQSSRSGSRPTPERPAHRKSLRASTMH